MHGVRRGVSKPEKIRAAAREPGRRLRVLRACRGDVYRLGAACCHGRAYVVRDSQLLHVVVVGVAPPPWRFCGASSEAAAGIMGWCCAVAGKCRARLPGLHLVVVGVAPSLVSWWGSLTRHPKHP